MRQWNTIFLVLACLVGGTIRYCAAAPPATTPHGGTAHNIPGTIEAEHYDDGDAEHAYHDVDEPNQGADYRGPTHVDIEKRPDASNGYGIGWTKPGEWLVYTVMVAEAGEYEVEFPVASHGKGGSFHLEFDGKNVTDSIDVPDTGSWQKLRVIRKKGVRLEKGLQVMKMVMEDEGPSGSIGDIDLLRFIKSP